VKIGIFSDIHKGIGATKLITVRPDVDVVAVAGDINEGAENSFVTLRAIVPEVIPIVFTMGNHEYYRRFLGEELEFAKAIAPNYNIRVLENDTTVIGPCGGVRFAGASLWTDYRLFGDHNAAGAMHAARSGMNDHRLISWQRDPWQRFRPQEALMLHTRSRAFFAEIAATPFDGVATVFLSHHAPDFRSVAPRYASDILSAAFASIIPLGSTADRWRLGAICASTAVLAGWTFPLFSHWTWGGGWLARLGANYGLGRGFLDIGGAGSIHTVAGLTALAVTWILGPRRGKYTSEGMPMAIPGHSAVLVLFGCLASFAGWLGFISAGAILFAGVESGRVVLIAVNTMLCASSGALAAALITRIRFGKPDASLTANGWVGGLVASSAVAPFVPPAAAMIVGLITGALVTFSVELIDLRLDVDDPGGTVSVHAVGGIAGILALGLFGRIEAGADGQFLAQLVGVATLIGFVLPLTYVLNVLLNLVLPQRVAAEGEAQGMDLHELGAGAYPEFMTHTDDFMPR